MKVIRRVSPTCKTPHVFQAFEGLGFVVYPKKGSIYRFKRPNNDDNWRYGRASFTYHKVCYATTS